MDKIFQLFFQLNYNKDPIIITYNKNAKEKCYI